MYDSQGLVDSSLLMEEWIVFGDKEEHPYMRFMAYWVAFNMLYEEYKTEFDQSETNAIKECYRRNSAQFSRYNPLRTGDVGIFGTDKVKQLLNPKETLKCDSATLKGETTRSFCTQFIKLDAISFMGIKGLEIQRIENSLQLVRPSFVGISAPLMIFQECALTGVNNHGDSFN